MRSIYWVLAAVLALGVVAGIAFGAYRAGERHGGNDAAVRVVTPGDGEAGEAVEVVRLDGRGWAHGGGFIPFGFLFPLLLIVLLVLVLRGAFGGWGGPGGWARPSPEEWHRRQHQEPQEGGPQGQQSSA